MKTRSQKILDRLGYLKSLRTNWETHWQEVADYVMPRKASIQRTHYPGDKRNLHIYDSTAIHANEVLASFLQSMLVNSSQNWLEFSSGDPKIDSIGTVQRWLQEASRTYLDVLHDTNFYSEIHEIFLDLGGFGTAALGAEEDDKRYLRYLAQHISGIYIDEGHDGMVDTLYRCFKWKAKQIVQRWPDSVKSRHIERAMASNPDDEFEVVHAIYPSDEISGGNTDLPYTGTYVLQMSGFILEEQGFREFPYAVPRWAKATGEVYGRSPAIKGLPDIKMINEVNRVTIRGAQKTVDPPVSMPDDGYLLPIRLLPGGINYRRAGMGRDDDIRPIITDARIDFGIAYMQDLRTRIRDHFFIDQLQLSQGPQMTATEVVQRVEENLRVLAPVLSRLEVECLRPNIKRSFGIMLRRGVGAIHRDNIPRELSGRTLQVQYTGLIARAQRTSNAQIYLRALQDAAPFLQANPNLMQIMDDEAVFRDIMQMHGVPVRTLREEDDLEKIRQGQAAAQEEIVNNERESRGLEQMAKVVELQKSQEG